MAGGLAVAPPAAALLARVEVRPGPVLQGAILKGGKKGGRLMSHDRHLFTCSTVLLGTVGHGW